MVLLCHEKNLMLEIKINLTVVQTPLQWWPSWGCENDTKTGGELFRNIKAVTVSAVQQEMELLGLENNVNFIP